MNIFLLLQATFVTGKYIPCEIHFALYALYYILIYNLIYFRESEDTMLLILKEIYGSRDIQTDAQLPQQSMSVERISSSSSSSLNSPAFSPSGSNVGTSLVMGIDPTVPMSGKPVGPPPKAGFVPKS